MDNNDNNSFDENSGVNDGLDSSKIANNQGFGSRLASGLREANNLRNEYKNSDGFGDFAKNIAKDKASQKINEGLSNLGQKAVKGISNLGQNSKSPIGNRKNPVPTDSVKKKRNEVNKKTQDARNKPNSKKQNSNVKAQLNEKVFKKGVKTAVNAVAPGAGEVAEKVLDTPVGEPAVEAARGASNPVAALKEGTKKLVQIVVSRLIKQNIIIILPIVLVLFIVVFISASLLIKHQDSVAYMGVDSDDEYPSGTIISEEYKSFYENVNSSGVRDKAMLIAVLTGYKDNDDYGSNGDYTSDCTDEELENGSCDTSYDIVSSTSKRKMKNYIKKVTKEINNSSSLEEGDYSDPQNTGSDFFQWLYKDFVEDYYSEYTSGLSADAKKKKKEEIVHYIYLFYDTIKPSGGLIGISYSFCPDGVTITNGRYAGTYDVEEYIKGVTAGEVGGWYDFPETIKAHAIAARTFLAYTYEHQGHCNVKNSGSFMAYRNPYVKTPSGELEFEKSNKFVEETSGIIIMQNGKPFPAQWVTIPIKKYITESGDNYIFDLLYNPNDDNSKHIYTIPKSVFAYPGKYTNYAGELTLPSESSGHHWGMVSYGALYEEDVHKKNYEEILRIFYGNDIEIGQAGANVSFNGEVSMPLQMSDPANWKKYVSRGYQLGTAKCYVDGNYTGKNNCDHLGVDFGINGITRGTPIYSIADGVVVKVRNENSKKGYGNYVIIGHDTNGDGSTDLYSLYAHQLEYSITVSEGQAVAAGTQIGKVGNTGNSGGNHLHFEINTCGTSERKCRLLDSSQLKVLKDDQLYYSLLDALASGNKLS